MFMSIKHKRTFLSVVLLALSCAAMTLGLAHKQLFQPRSASSTDSHIKPAALRADETSALPGALAEAPQTSAQFDLSRNVIAGGGGTSSGSGNLELSGTNGQRFAA